MSILITSDLHLSESPRDMYRHDFMAWFKEQAKKLKADHVLILGDLTEVKDHHGSWLVNEIVKHIYDLAQLSRVTVLRGNHDYIDPDSPFFAFLNELENVTWINIPTRFKLDSWDCLFLPHTRDYKKDWPTSLLQINHDWIFAHNTFEGADIGHGKRLSGIPQTIFREDAYIISGDIHIPQELEKVIYVGSPYRVTFGDTFKPRIILIKNSGYASIYCPGPYKQLVEIKTLDDLKNQKQLRKGDILKVRCELNSEQYDKWQETKDAIRTWGEAAGYVMELIQPVVELQARTRKRKQEIKSDKDLLCTYALRRTVSEQTLNTGLKLMEEG